MLFRENIDAVGLAEVKTVSYTTGTGERHRVKDEPNEIVGIVFAEDGMNICQDADNFEFMLPVEKVPSEMTCIKEEV